MADLNTFIEKENVLPKAELPHFFNESQFKGAYNFSISCTKFLDDFYLEFLEIRRTWNFLNPSPWFLDSIKDHVEFVPDLLLDLQNRALFLMMKSFAHVGTYQGFELLCQAIFGQNVSIEYVDPYQINISNIETNLRHIICSEYSLNEDNNFMFCTEDDQFIFITEDEFLPPAGIGIIESILRKNLPAGIGEIVNFDFVDKAPYLTVTTKDGNQIITKDGTTIITQLL
jgi:hypothetical protein